MNQKSCPEPVTALISNSRQSREKKKLGTNVLRNKCLQSAKKKLLDTVLWLNPVR